MAPQRHPLTWTEDYDDLPVSVPAPVDIHCDVQDARCEIARDVADGFTRVGRVLCWVAVLAVGLLVLCQLHDLGLLDTPQDQHPSGVVSRYGEVSHAN